MTPETGSAGIAGILSGVRVVDLTQYIPGPYATLMLADMGADVVKVEPPGGDPMRRLGDADPDGTAPAYKVLNAGKTVVRLDLKSEAGSGQFAQLLDGADVLVESFRPSVMDRLGFGRSRLAEINPGLVHVAISGWGQTGPYSGRAGHDINYMALGGGLVASGASSGPVMAFPPTSDFAAGTQAALAVVAGLLRRHGNGKGVFADISMMETVLSWQALSLNQALRGSGPDRRYDMLNGGAACYQIYRTRDGRFLSVGALERKFWVQFCNAIEQPEWIARQWEPMPQRDLIDRVGDAIRRRTLADWLRVFEPLDCCVEPVLTWQEVFEHPHIVARERVQVVGGDDPLAMVLPPMVFDGMPLGGRLPLREREAGTVVTAWSAGKPDDRQTATLESAERSAAET